MFTRDKSYSAVAHPGIKIHAQTEQQSGQRIEILVLIIVVGLHILLSEFIEPKLS